MSDAVKRHYHSPRRVAQRDATRAAIREAATSLFLADGYANTPITAIADEAEVSVQTVYGQFGSKAAIAKELLDVSIVGDDDPTPVAEREWFRAVFEPRIGGRACLARYAACCSRINSGAAAAFEIIRRGADSDSELAELWVTSRRQRRVGVSVVLDAALRQGHLRDDTTRDEAIDLMLLLHGPETYNALVFEAGWTVERYEAWLASTLVEQILDTSPT